MFRPTPLERLGRRAARIEDALGLVRERKRLHRLPSPLERMVDRSGSGQNQSGKDRE
jgi:hypothetical protein